MKPLPLWTRRRELTYRVLNTKLLGLLARLYRWYGLKGTFTVGKNGIHYTVDGVSLHFEPKEYGCTVNADSSGLGEDHTRELLFKVMPEGSVFYDVGAHGGTYTLSMMVKRPDVIVHSFEPLAGMLRRNLLLSGKSADRVHEVAVGEENGTVRMVTSERSKNHVGAGGDGDVEVQLVKLDSYVEQRGLERPNYFKIDIEGFEFPALKGAIQVLRESKPVLICEINHNMARFGYDLKLFLKFVDDLGYSVHRYWAGQMSKVDTEVASDVASLGRTAYENFWFLPKTGQLPPLLDGARKGTLKVLDV